MFSLLLRNTVAYTLYTNRTFILKYIWRIFDQNSLEIFPYTFKGFLVLLYCSAITEKHTYDINKYN